MNLLLATVLLLLRSVPSACAEGNAVSFHVPSIASQSLAPSAVTKLLVLDGKILEGRVDATFRDGVGYLNGQRWLPATVAPKSTDTIAVTDEALRDRYLAIPYIGTRVSRGLPLSSAVDSYYDAVNHLVASAGRQFAALSQSRGSKRAAIEAAAILHVDSLGLCEQAEPVFNDCGGGIIQLPTIGEYRWPCPADVQVDSKTLAMEKTTQETFTLEVKLLRAYFSERKPVVVIYGSGSRSVYIGETIGRQAAAEILAAAGVIDPKSELWTHGAVGQVVAEEHIRIIRERAGSIRP